MWYVLKVAEGKEDTACETCRKAFPAGCRAEVFVPCYARPYHRDGEWKEIMKALFPDYIFVDTDKDGAEAVKEIVSKRIPHTAQTVCVGDEFVPIYEEEQRFLESLMDKDHIVTVSNGNIVDDRVVVDEGPLRQYSDKVCWYDRHKRMANIEMTLLGVTRRIKIGLVLANRIYTRAG
ncbi:MAG: antiterminator LoaP [Lachnospiraceae bacterium]|nr:antiterminator LoaP [Lachnospiraceae bacterium]